MQRVMGVVSPAKTDLCFAWSEQAREFAPLELNMMSEVSPLNHPDPLRPQSMLQAGGNPFGLTIMSLHNKQKANQAKKSVERFNQGC